MLGSFAEQCRKKFSLTQEYIANALNLSRPTYIQFERGKYDLTISEAKKLSALFNISLDDLLNEREPNIHVTVKKDKRATNKLDQNDIRISVPQQKVDKLKQILFYILKKVGGKPNVGMTVIYKLL